MRLTTDAYIKQIASDALGVIGVSEPPVPIDDVVASLCIPVRSVNLPPFFTAATVYEDGLPVMVVNTARPAVAQRDALAHMLGHVLLLLADESEAFPRRSSDHAAADRLARELIMPAELVVTQARMWFNDYRYLSRLFAVSEGAMLDRLRELGLVKTHGIAWNY